ncbi:hypothetical protein [Mesorhizobium sp. BH1-1-5]|uniref:hypothetical protein n=1 Tax=Mesorhizobium sp. BH1-1-5 TaxID=2876661 RepID=UPI001CCD9190|nr:hypothetical protein [Mesorhizobium sp. BH1-1-5]
MMIVPAPQRCAGRQHGCHQFLGQRVVGDCVSRRASMRPQKLAVLAMHALRCDGRASAGSPT